MSNRIISAEFLEELKREAPASRKCLERLSEKLFDWKPHEKSMNLGYLALLVAEIPQWISYIIDKSEIDFATYPRHQLTTAAALVNHYDACLQGAKKSLQNFTDSQLEEMFHLKNNGQLLYSSTKKENISSTINHWVHHRGQLTVYMRLNNIPVPSIYGPSADDKGF